MPTNKKRLTIYLPDEVARMVDSKSKEKEFSNSEFVEEAVKFYIGYLNAQSDNDFLPQVLLGAMQGIVATELNSVKRNQFKIAVELDLLANLLGTTIDVPYEQLNALRGRSVSAVKHINGVLRYEDSGYYQQENSEEPKPKK